MKSIEMKIIGEKNNSHKYSNDRFRPKADIQL